MFEPLPILSECASGEPAQQRCERRAAGSERSPACTGACADKRSASEGAPSPALASSPETQETGATQSHPPTSAAGRPGEPVAHEPSTAISASRPGEAPAADTPAFHGEHDHQLATLGSLVASIAHEINNILTPIASYADLARMHPGDEALTAKALQRAASGAREASEIATAILSLATPDRGVAPSRCDDLRDIIHRSTLCLGSEPARLGVKVVWDSPQGLAPAMPAVALQHVLVNLLINALRASKRGGVIEVRVQRGDQTYASAKGCVPGTGQHELPAMAPARGRAEGVEALPVQPGSTWNLAEITVRDAGVGIPAALREGIFRDFESGCGSTGLGLAICRRLLEKWGGAIRLAETGPEGSAFAVSAPLAEKQSRAA